MPSSSSKAPDLDKLLDGTPFRALARLGSGGMGDIYEASSASHGRALVVKVLRAEFDPQSDGAERLCREGELLERLHHDNIVRTHGHGRTAEGRPYVVLERIDGCTLRDELRRRGALPLDEALDYVRQLLAALDAVHDAGIVHRDVKPANVMLTFADGAASIKLIDFGVAKIAETERPPLSAASDPSVPRSFATREGVCVGTPRYVSPEQASGNAVDRRSDIYAAGLLLYALVVGRGPFDEIAGARRLLAAHRASDPPHPSSFAKQRVPEAVETVILRAIAKRPEDRFASAAAFSRELARVHGQLREMRAAVRRFSTDARPRSYPKRKEYERCVATSRAPRVSRSYGASHAHRAGARVAEHGFSVANARSAKAPRLETALGHAETADSRLETVRPRSERAIVQGSSGRAAPPSRPKPGDRKGAFSRRGVVFCAIASFAVASGLAMWFVR